MAQLLLTLILLLAGSTTCLAGTLPSIANDGKRLPGKFVWFDLITPHVGRAQDFYHTLFGWDYRPVASERGEYHLILHNDRSIGGIFQPNSPRPSALWIGAMSVADARQAESYAIRQGAEIILPPRELPDLGTRLLLRDPQGALIALLQTSHGDPADRPVNVGEFFWLDLFTGQPSAAAEFYQGLAGYEVHEREIENISRLLLVSGGYARAGIDPLPKQVDRPGWLPYVLVNSVADTLKLVPPAGGQILIEPQAELLGGRLAVLSDPDGGVVGILEWPTQAEEAP